ncbi:restriction endonuclease subunit S [Actinomadura napierensis]|uniref:Restriction endonuclease subunit S n=1 Tax=Actinomadura napierensis TaxID=267854 RepID=A0ABN2Y8I6_9ACTN
MTRLGDVVAFTNGRARSAAGTRYPTYGANGVIGTSGEFNADRNSTIVGRVGSYCGAVHYAHERCWVTDNAIIAMPKDGVHPRYVYYLLKGLGLNHHRIGSGQPLLTHAILNTLPVHDLPRAGQNAVAEILGALDDKIAVNERLAADADALVRARYTELAASAADSVRLDALGGPVTVNVPAADIGAGENHIGLEHIAKRHMWLSEWAGTSAVLSTKRRFSAGDVLFGKLRPYFHKVGLAFVDGVASTDILVVRPKDARHRGWLLAALSSDEVVAHASALSDGTRMPRAKWPDLARYGIPWPGEPRAREFGELVDALADRVRAARAESAALAGLRDALLPEMLAGRTKAAP